MHFIRLNQIFLPVADLRRATNWYAEHFGLTAGAELKVDGRRMRELSFAASSFYLVEHDSVNRYTHIPFNLHTNIVVELRARLAAEGVAVTEMAEDDDMLCFDFYDPEGNRIGIVYERNNRHAPSLEVGGTFLTVRNLELAVEWYAPSNGQLPDIFL